MIFETREARDQHSSVKIEIPRSRRVRRERLLIMVKRRWLGLIGLTIICLVASSALFAPWISPYDPQSQNLRMALEPPGRLHWMGTDQLGRDILSRTIHGGRISLMIGFGSVAMALALGGTAGMIAGYYGRWLDAVIMRAMDVLLAFPGLIMAAGVMAVLGVGVRNLIIALALRSLPVFARLARNVTLSLKALAYVEATRSIGASSFRILSRHILPNLISPLLVIANLRVGGAILIATSLSFLGMGVPPGTAEWGAMLRDALGYMRMAGGWTMVVFPGLAIALTVLGINLFGDDLRDVWDPRMRS